MLEKVAQGAVIGAAIGLTISAITSYIRYRKGELTREEAFTKIGEDTVKSALIGGDLSGLTLFIPGGGIGIIAGVAIGIYLHATLTNILDEVFGKGFYRELLHANGYIMATSRNLHEGLQQFKTDRQAVSETIDSIKRKSERTEELFKQLDKNLEALNE